MKAEEGVVEDGGKRQAVEQIHKGQVHLLVVFPSTCVLTMLTLLLEIEVARHLLALVVAPKQKDPLRAVELEDDQHHHHLDGKIATIHVVSQKEKRILLQVELQLAQPEEVVELAVDVADDPNLPVYSQQIGLHLYNTRQVRKSFIHLLSSYSTVCFYNLPSFLKKCIILGMSYLPPA